MATFTNQTQGPKGVHTLTGLVYIEAGQTADLEVSDGELAAARATGWFAVVEAEPAVAGLTAKHKDSPQGNWAIYAGDEEVIDGLKREDAEAFNELGDAAKAQFVTDLKPA